VGAAGGVLGGLAMNVFTRLVSAATHGHEVKDAAPGRERVGRGMQPPQAEMSADDDAAVRVGSTAYKLTTGHTPDRRLRLQLGAWAHYTFSGMVGICYALVAEHAPVLRKGWGAVPGALVWAIADEGAMPVLGLSRGPRQLTGGMHAYSLLGHWIYGATLECVRRLGTHRRRLHENGRAARLR
jgi:uncharacterized membrane protein YagU involved in acid resistance